MGLRGFAQVLLVSWLFTLVACFYSDLQQTPTHVAEGYFVAHEHHVDDADDDTANQADACCTILQNLPIFSKAGDIEKPLQNLIHALLPSVFVIQSALLLAVGTRFLFADHPPGKPSYAFIANSLWPNAPPR